jgi:hypothetical protein
MLLPLGSTMSSVTEIVLIITDYIFSPYELHPGASRRGWRRTIRKNRGAKYAGACDTAGAVEGG